MTVSGNKVIKKTENKNSFIYLVFIVCVVACVSFFADIINVFMTTHDDIRFYMHVRLEDVLQSSWIDAKRTGRFYFIYSELLYSIPYFWDNKIWFKCVEFFSILFSVFGMYKLVYKHIDKMLAYMGVILFFVFAQVDYQHNVFVSYVFHHQICMGFIFLSFSLFLDYFAENDNKKLLSSGILYAIPLFLYEPYFCYIVSYFFIALFYSYKNISSIKIAVIEFLKILKTMKYHILASIVFLVVYIGFKLIYPSMYEGAIMHVSALQDVIKTIVTFGLGLFPLRVWFECFRSLDIWALVSNTSVETMIISMVCATVSCVLICKVKSISLKRFLFIILVGGLSVFLPCIPYALTSKYSGWVHNGAYGFVPSYFGFFFIIILITLILVYLYQRLNNLLKYVYLLCACFVIFIMAIITNETNKIVAAEFERTLFRYEAFDMVVSSEEFLKIPTGSTVYIPDYAGIHNDVNISEMYLKIYGDNDIQLEKDYNNLQFNNTVYAVRYDADCKMIMLAQINSDFITDSFYLYSLDEPIGNVTFYSDNNRVELYGDKSVLFVESYANIGNVDFVRE